MNLQVFKNDNYGEIRTVLKNDQIWFVAKDICNVLGIENHRDTITRLSDKQRESVLMDTLGGKQKVTAINESGLYKIVFKSRKPEAEKFTDWVTSEVLPSIRKHGMYATDNFVEAALSDPTHMIKVLEAFKEEREKRIKAEKRNTILQHVNKTYTMTEIAKELNLKSATELNKVLASKKIQYKINGTWVMYSDYSNLGYEDIKQQVLDNGKVIYHRKITQCGREFILELLEGDKKGGN